jgi:D-alanine-D-alanine ligase
MGRRVAVIMGGESRERDVSRVTGTAVAKALSERSWDVVLIDTEEGITPFDGGGPPIGTQPPDVVASERSVAAGPSAIVEFVRRLVDVDAVWIALHGGWGEDGTVQALFELIGVPYTGSGVLGSALAMDKDRAKRVMRASGVPTPEWMMLRWSPGSPPPAADVARVVERFPGDIVVKPNSEGSTVGLNVVREGEDPRAALETAARYDDRVLVEPFIAGRELTVAILGHEALPVVEIIPEGGVYTYEAKYTRGKSRYECPAQLPAELAAKVRATSVAVYDALGCEGFARVDYRLANDGGLHCLEVNTIPGMTPLSLVPMAAKAAGLSFAELVERILELAIARGPHRRRAVASGA